jgi:hypothetical protein
MFNQKMAVRMMNIMMIRTPEIKCKYQKKRRVETRIKIIVKKIRKKLKKKLKRKFQEMI